MILAVLVAIFVPGLLLTAAGLFLDFSLTWTVFNFTQNTEPLLDAVKIVWTAARDMANILIIGMFVYMAIAKILSLQKDFNKIIVSLLSVAMLINFSFFFAQVPIDISNWASVQIYNATMHDSTSTEKFSVSQVLIENMEGTYTLGTMITNLGDKIRELMNEVGESAKSNVINSIPIPGVQSGDGKNIDIWKLITDSGAALTSLFMGGVASMMLTLVAAILFFRIGFILVGRWIILILLMATSSLAFAAMLIPSLNKYWVIWRNGIVYNAIVAPLLLFMLSAIVILMGSMKTVLNTDTGASSLFVFLTGLGFLWAAIRISTMLSTNAMNSAGGAGKWVNGLLGGIQGRAIGGVIGGVGFAGRNTVGKGFAGMGDRLEKFANSRFSNSRGAGKLMGDSIKNIGTKMSKVGKKSSFDVRTTGAFKNLMKGSSIETGKGIKDGFAAIDEKKSKEREAWGKKHDEAITKASREKMEYETERDRERAEHIKEQEREKKESEKEITKIQESIRKDTAALSKNETDKSNLTAKGEQLATELSNATKEQDKLAQEIDDTSGKTGEMQEQERKIEKIKNNIASISSTNDPLDAARLGSYQDRLKEATSHLSTMKDAHGKLLEEKNEALTAVNKRLPELQREFKEFESTKEGDLSRLEVEGNKINAKLNSAKSELIQKEGVRTQQQAILKRLHEEHDKYMGIVENEALTLAQGLTAVRALTPDMSKGTTDEQIAELETKRRDIQARIDSATDAADKKMLAKDKELVKKMQEEMTKLREYKRALKESFAKQVKEMRQTAAQNKDYLRKKKLEDAYIKFGDDTLSGTKPSTSVSNTLNSSGSTHAADAASSTGGAASPKK